MVEYEFILDDTTFTTNDTLDVSIEMSLNATNVLNDHQGNLTATTSGILESLIQASGSPRHVSYMVQVFITFFYGLGISANICALVLLAKGETARNRKQTLMVRCLACNDLVALLGSFLLMYMQLYMGKRLASKRWFCVLRVVLRTFGLSSGCVAVVMAAERWMALTRPFSYQRHVTHSLIKRAIFSLWLLALFLVCLPLVGFGLYYDDSPGSRRKCKRYRSATEMTDIAYAYSMFTFGVTLCLVIVCCNMAVVRVLCRMGRKSLAHLGRTTMRKDSHELAFNHTTPEEVSFAKLMVILCVFFVVCWVPQMITIVMAQVRWKNEHHYFYRLADICMALNFTFDPVVYVLSRRPHRKGLRKLLKPLCQFCWPETRRSQSLRLSQDATKITREAIQNSISSSSQKDCITMERINRDYSRSSTKTILQPPTSKEPYQWIQTQC